MFAVAAAITEAAAEPAPGAEGTKQPEMIKEKKEEGAAAAKPAEKAAEKKK